MIAVRRAVPLGIACALALVARPVPAQEAPPPAPVQPEAPKEAPLPAAPPAPEAPPAAPRPAAQPPEAPLPATPAPEELRQLEAALGADAAATAATKPSAAPAAGPLAGTGLELAAILDTAGAWFDGEPTAAGAHDPAGTGFHLQSLEVSIGGNVDPYFRLDTHLAFTLEGVEVEEAYGTTLALPGSLQLRAGKLLTRFGRLNATHPHAWSFVDRPLVLGAILGPDGAGGVGVEGSWLTPLPWYVELVATATIPSVHEHEGEAAHEGGREPIETTNGTFALKQFFPLSDALGLGVGLSGRLGRDPLMEARQSRTGGADVYLRWRPPDSPDRTAVTLSVEALARIDDNEEVHDRGAYAELTVRFDPRWEAGVRGEWYDRPDEATSHLVEDPGTGEPHGEEELLHGERVRGAAQLTFYPTELSRLRLQGSREQPLGGGDPVHGVVLALEVLVGAHGAHTY